MVNLGQEDLDSRYKFLPKLREAILSSCYIEGDVEIQAQISHGVPPEAWLDIDVFITPQDGPTVKRQKTVAQEEDEDRENLIFVADVIALFSKVHSLNWRPRFLESNLPPEDPEDWLHIVGVVEGAEVQITIQNCALEHYFFKTSEAEVAAELGEEDEEDEEDEEEHEGDEIIGEEIAEEEKQFLGYEYFSDEFREAVQGVLDETIEERYGEEDAEEDDEEYGDTLGDRLIQTSNAATMIKMIRDYPPDLVSEAMYAAQATIAAALGRNPFVKPAEKEDFN